MENSEDVVGYGKHYSEETFLDKALKVAKKAGVKVLYAGFLLYYTMKDENCSAKDKVLIVGALGYFILPFDLVPDFTPLLGYTDDLAALILVVKTVYGNVTPEIKEQAKAKTRSIFGEADEKYFVLF
jgi:uncharacterized membrane protein YkvA (DUF1232 family)